MNSGVYAIIAPSNKRYIGSAVDMARRRNEHFSELRRGAHKNPLLQAAAHKYGVHALIFDVVERCDELQLFEREQAHIDANDWGLLYNLAPVAGGVRGYRFTPEQCKHQGAKARQTWAREGYREAQRAKHVERWTDPAERVAQSTRLAAHYADPALRARYSALAHAQGLSAANTSGLKGVSFVKAKQRWRVDVIVRGTRHVRGGFRDPETAYAYRLYFLATQGVFPCM